MSERQRRIPHVLDMQGPYVSAGGDRPISPETNGFKLEVDGVEAGRLSRGDLQQSWRWSQPAEAWPAQFLAVPLEPSSTQDLEGERFPLQDFFGPAEALTLAHSPDAQVYAVTKVPGGELTAYLIRSSGAEGRSLALQWYKVDPPATAKRGFLSPKTRALSFRRLAPSGEAVTFMGWRGQPRDA